jgi:membrane protein implicated in regulation of membrane protease activity
MKAQWIWLIAAAVLLLAYLFLRFRPLLSMAGGLLGAAAAAHFGAAWWLQVPAFLLLSVLLEWALAGLFSALRREKDDPKVAALVGATGKIQDIVDRKKGYFLLHSNGGDWIALAEQPGLAALGDHVEVVGVRGKKAVVRRIAG